MSLLAGCYERFLFGYKLDGEVDEEQAGVEEQGPGLQRAFTHAAHKGVVKCIAAAGQFAATGGADDLIHLYDLKNDKDLGFLMSPGEGAVTALTFFAPAAAYNPTHLITGSADGSIRRAGGGWQCMKTVRGHRKEVTGIAVHPSGLIALSVSRDCCLRMWDLVKGRCTFTVKLEVEADGVQFCGEDGGQRYALLCGGRLTLHGVADEQGVLATLAHPRRVLCMAWAPGNRVVSGSEDGSLRLWDAQAGVELLCISRAHASRVRALALLPAASSGGRLLLASASSDGSLKLWDLTKAAAAGVPGASGGACLAEAQTRARLTCLAAADAPAVMATRLAAAAAVVRQAAARLAEQPPRQQQQQERPGGKRGAEAAPKPAGKRQKQQQGGTVDAAGRPAAAPGSGGGKPKRQPRPAGSGAAADAVVVRGGVVEFLDSPEQQKRREKQQKGVAQRSQQAAQRGERYRSMPGERPAQAARPGQRPGQKKQRPSQKQRPGKQRK